MVNLEGGHDRGNAVISELHEGRTTIKIEACKTSLRVGMLRNLGSTPRRYEYDLRTGGMIIPSGDQLKMGPPIHAKVGMEIHIEVDAGSFTVTIEGEKMTH